MKKALSLAMAALLALSLTACGNSGSTAPAESSTPAQETAAPAESVEASTEASSSEAASDTGRCRQCGTENRNCIQSLRSG